MDRMHRIVNFVDNVNERWSIYRSMFICDNENEASEIFARLFEKGYPVKRTFVDPGKCRFLIKTWETFDNTLDFSEFNVIYTTSISQMHVIKDIVKEHRIKCIAII
jgi:hypothetical protein